MNIINAKVDDYNDAMVEETEIMANFDQKLEQDLVNYEASESQTARGETAREETAREESESQASMATKIQPDKIKQAKKIKSLGVSHKVFENAQLPKNIPKMKSVKLTG